MFVHRIKTKIYIIANFVVSRGSVFCRNISSLLVFSSVKKLEKDIHYVLFPSPDEGS